MRRRWSAMDGLQALGVDHHRQFQADAAGLADELQQAALLFGPGGLRLQASKQTLSILDLAVERIAAVAACQHRC